MIDLGQQQPDMLLGALALRNIEYDHYNAGYTDLTVTFGIANYREMSFPAIVSWVPKLKASAATGKRFV